MKNLLKQVRLNGVGLVHLMIDSFHLNKKQDVVKKEIVDKEPPSVNSSFSFYRKLFSYCPGGVLLLTCNFINICRFLDYYFINYHVGPELVPGLYGSSLSTSQLDTQYCPLLYFHLCLHRHLFYPELP